MAHQQTPPPSVPTADRGTPFKDMSRGRKTLFICKLAISIVTFGLAFPNVMAD
jgi:hypothetical protein